MRAHKSPPKDRLILGSKIRRFLRRVLGEDQDPSGSLCTKGCCEISLIISFHPSLQYSDMFIHPRWALSPTSFCPFSVSGGGFILYPFFFIRPWCLSISGELPKILMLKLKLPFVFSGRHFHILIIFQFCFVSFSLFNSHPPSPVFGSSLVFWKVRKERF